MLWLYPLGFRKIRFNDERIVHEVHDILNTHHVNIWNNNTSTILIFRQIDSIVLIDSWVMLGGGAAAWAQLINSLSIN